MAAIRDRVIVVLPGSGDWVEIFPDQRGDAPIVRFISGEQIEAMGDTEYAAPPAGEHLYSIRVHRLLVWAVAHGFLDTLPAEQRDAIHRDVKDPQDPTQEG